MIALHQNISNCQNTLTVLTQWGEGSLQDVWVGQTCATDAGTTQDNFVFPAGFVTIKNISLSVNLLKILVINTNFLKIL